MRHNKTHFFLNKIFLSKKEIFFYRNISICARVNISGGDGGSNSGSYSGRESLLVNISLSVCLTLCLPIWWGLNILLKFQLPSSYGLG